MAQKKAHEIDTYLHALKREVMPALVLVYGSDAGGVYDIARRVRVLWLTKTHDPLQYVALDAASLTKMPGALTDEAATLLMFGGRKLVHIANGGGVLEAVKIFLQTLDHSDLPDACVLIEAGSLAPASLLRKTVEKHPRAMALPCYPLQTRDVATYARNWAKQEGFTIEASAIHTLAERLTGDRGIMQRTLECLALYKGGGKSGNKGRGKSGARSADTLISLADIDAILGEAGASELTSLVDAIALGELATMDNLLVRLAAAGKSPQACLAMVKQHFQNLHLAIGAREAGASAAQAVAAIQPPVHFLRRKQVERQVALWSRAKLNRALNLLHDAEIKSRSNWQPTLAAAFVARSFLQLAAAATR